MGPSSLASILPVMPTAPTPPAAPAVPAISAGGGSFVSQLKGAMGSGAAPVATTPAPPAATAPSGGVAATGPAGTSAAAPAAEAEAGTPTTGAAPAAKATPGTYANLTGDTDASPEILKRLDALAAKKGVKFHVTSGYRSIEEQQRLWDNRASNPNPVARPGSSLHHKGTAADVSIGGRPIQSVISDAELRAAGLVPLKGDPPHVQLP